MDKTQDEMDKIQDEMDKTQDEMDKTQDEMDLDDVIDSIAEMSRFARSEAMAATVASLLRAGFSAALVARRLGIDQSIVLRLLSIPSVRAAAEDGRRARTCALHHGLTEAATEAIDTYRHLMTDPSVPPEIRLNAARDVLTWTVGRPDGRASAVLTSMRGTLRMDGQAAEIAAQTFQARLAAVLPSDDEPV